MPPPATALYLAAVQARAGKSLAALGILELLSRRVDALGYFRPVASGEDDRRIALARDRYHLGDRATWAYTDAEVDALLAQGRQEEVYKGVIAAYRDLAERCAFVLVEGTDQTGSRSALEFDFNARMATHLGAAVVALVNGGGATAADVVESVQLAERALTAEGVTTPAVLVNRVAPEDVDRVRTLLDEVDVMTAVIPEDPRLSMPTLSEIVDALGATEIHPGRGDLDTPVISFKVAAMSLPNMLDRITDGELVIAPADRHDVLVGVLASRLADTYPDASGIVLTGGFDPAPQILRLIEGLGGIPTPIYATSTDTFATAQLVAAVQPVIAAGSRQKIATALGLFEQHVDTGALLEQIEVTRSERVTPLMFEYDLIERARADRQHIVLPEGTDERILQAAALLHRRRVVDLTLLGAEEAVRRQASAVGVDIDGIPVVDPQTSDARHRYAEAYVEERRHKGIVLDRAEEVMTDVSYFGTMMVHLGEADGMVSGAAHTTAHTIRPAFEFVRTRPGVDSVSSVFLMCLSDRVLVYGDCAIIPNPTPEQLADIAISSAETARTFGIDPVVAMLSYSTGVSGSGTDVDRVRTATDMVRDRAPDLAVEGPIQYDAAVDAGVGRKKLPESDVAGRATVFVFPDLNTGNNTYKAVQRSAGAVAIGPVLQGLNKPVNDLSRGCTVTDVVNTVAITAIQAQMVDGGRPVKVLVLNSGSSSVKYEVFEDGRPTHALTSLADGLVEEVDDHTAALGGVLDHLADNGLLDDLRAVGHRVVHGGEDFTAPTLLDDDVVARIDALSPLAPLHNPPALEGIRAARQLRPDIPHVAVFDTAFHATLPPEAFRYAVPRDWYETHGVRRYGFHGTSHAHVAGRAAEHLGRPLDQLRLITLHLGNGASACAIDGGRSVDTSMGLSPLEGLVMGTRSGDVDPAVVFHLMRAGMSSQEIERSLNRASGLKGMAGDNDVRQVRRAAAEGEEAARLALEVTARRIRKYVGAYLAILGGLDALVFTAGIGENDAAMRADVVAPLTHLGLDLDPDANAAADPSAGPVAISRPGSPATVLVVATDEERRIAEEVVALVG